MPETRVVMMRHLLLLIAPLLLAFAFGCSGDEEVISTTAPASGTPEITPTPEDWQTHSDIASGLSFEYPADLKASESSVDVTGKDGLVRTHRIITIETSSGLPGASFAIAPNPYRLSLKAWVESNPGWTSEPTAIIVAGQPALLFPLNASGEEKPVIYFAYGEYVIGVKRIPSNTQNDGLRPVISEAEFERLLASVQLAS
jgi:hypothetical protein